MELGALDRLAALLLQATTPPPELPAGLLVRGPTRVESAARILPLLTTGVGGWLQL